MTIKRVTRSGGAHEVFYTGGTGAAGNIPVGSRSISSQSCVQNEDLYRKECTESSQLSLPHVFGCTFAMLQNKSEPTAFVPSGEGNLQFLVIKKDADIICFIPYALYCFDIS